MASPIAATNAYAAMARLADPSGSAGVAKTISGAGNGPNAAYVDALGKSCGIRMKVRDYHQHAAGAGSDATAVSFIEAETVDGRVLWGVGMDSNIGAASLKAVTSAANRIASPVSAVA